MEKNLLYLLMVAENTHYISECRSCAELGTHRIAGVVREIWVHPLLKQGHPQKGAQDNVQAAFGDLQEEIP